MNNTPPQPRSTHALQETQSKESFPKRQRVARACDTCRKRKVRCDAVAPVCGYCAGLGFACTYWDSGKRTNNNRGNVAEIEDRLIRMEALLSELVPVEPDGVVSASSSKVSAGRQKRVLPWEPLGGSINSEFSKTQEQKNTIAENDSASLHTKIEAAISGITFLSFTSDIPGPPRYMGASSGYYVINKDPSGTKTGLRDTEENQSTDDSQKAFVLRVDLPEVYDTAYTLQSCAALVTGGHGMKYNMDKEGMRKKGIDPEIFLLPSWEFAEALLDVYWCQCHMYFPFIHRPSILSQIRDCAAGNGEPPRLLLNAMFALACRFSTDPSLVAASETYILRARSLLALIWDNAQFQSISTVEGLLLMTMYEYGQANPSRTWFYLGSAIRIAQDMGFNFYGTAKMDTSLLGLKPEAVATMRRIWSACYIMDRLVAAALGRPITINESEINTEIPLTSDEGDLDEEYQENSYGAASPSAVFPTPDSLSTAPMNRSSNESSKSDLTDPPTLFNFVQLVKLCTILGKVVRKVNSPKQDSASAAEMHPIHSAMDEWAHQLPKYLQYDVIMNARRRSSEGTINTAEESDEVEQLAISPFSWFLQLVYHTTIILLHRPYIRITRPYLKFPKNASLIICTNSATAIANMLDTISGTELRSAPTFIIFCLYTVTTVHLNNFMFNGPPTGAQSRASGDVSGSEEAFESPIINEARRSLVKMSRAFDDLRYVWPAAARCRNLLKAILGQEITSIDRGSEAGATTIQIVNYSKANSNSSLSPTAFLGEPRLGDRHANPKITEADSLFFLDALLGTLGEDEAKAASTADRAFSSKHRKSSLSIGSNEGTYAEHDRRGPQVPSSNLISPTKSISSMLPWQTSKHNAHLPSAAGIQYHNNGRDQLVQPPSVPSHIGPYMNSAPLMPHARPAQSHLPQQQPIYSNSHPHATSRSNIFPRFQEHPQHVSYPPQQHPHYLHHPHFQQQDFGAPYPHQQQVAPSTYVAPQMNNIRRNEPDPNVQFWNHEESNPSTMAGTGGAPLPLRPQASRKNSLSTDYMAIFQ